MAECDFHFKHESRTPVNKKPKRFKKPNPAPPINSRRNPSALPNESSPYDSVSEKKIMDRVEEIEIDIGQFDFQRDPDKDIYSSSESLKIYSPENKKSDKGKDSKKLIRIAAVLVAAGIVFLGIGLYIWLNIYNF